MKRIIEVLPYQKDWPELFNHEASLLQLVFSPILISIDHIGSTSVPDLKAKPTIDILVEVKDVSDIDRYYPEMTTLGYLCRGECLDATIPGTPGRYYFSKEVEGKRLFHVHVCQTGHFQIEELVGLRDYLRNHKEIAEEYGGLKYQLAHEFRDDNIGYMNEKNIFVKKMIAAAKEWKKSTRNSRTQPVVQP